MKEFAGNIENPDFRDRKTGALADILRERGGTPKRLLVVGCGKGIEAAILARHLNAVVIGIDIKGDFDAKAACIADLRQGDATRMAFADKSFDFVYSFHVLEHIPEYRKALYEIRRVLKPGGRFLIGTPNRSRIIGYLGSNDTAISEKIRWNIEDWRAKLGGKFRNEEGAHAGFMESELHETLSCIFSVTESITSDYYRRVYHMRKFLVNVICCTGLTRWLFPAVYFYGVR